MIFFVGMAGFVLCWIVFGSLYLTRILPVVARSRGSRSHLEGLMQANVFGHVRHYRKIAEAQANRKMMRFYRLCNAFACLGLFFFLTAVLSSIFLQE